MGTGLFTANGTILDGSGVTLTATQIGQTTVSLNIPSWGSTGTAASISGFPTITGTMEVGEVLTANAASVTGDPTPTRTWQWLRNGAVISGATSSTYTLVSADDEKTISVRQREVNDFGADTSTSPGRGVGTSEVEWQFVYQGSQDAGNATSDSFTVPIPSTLTGDWNLYIMLGSTDTFDTLKLGGVDATMIVPTPDGDDDQTGGAGGRMSLFTIPVTGLTGSGNFSFATTLLSPDGDYVVTVFAVRGAVLQDQFDDYYVYLGTGGGGGFGGVEVPGDNSLLIGLVSGHTDGHTDNGGEVYPEWTVLENAHKLTATGAVDAHVLAVAENVPAGVYDEGVEFDSNSTERQTVALLVFVPIGAPVPSPQVVQWSVEDEAAVTGDIIRVDVQANPFLKGSRVSHYEIEMQKAGGTVIERVLGGGANNYVRRHRADENTTTRCRLRPVFQNQSTGVLDRSTAWSDHIDVTTTTGVPRVTLTANKTTVLKDEAILLEVEARGFNTLRAQTIELDFWNTVDVSEHGDLACLPNLYVEEFGQKVRHINRAHMWAFAAKGTGTKTFTSTVRDLHGNIAMATLDVTVVDPLTAFDASDIYALSTADNFTGVPAGANTYTSLASIIAATPTSGDALILIDQDETGGDGAEWVISGADSLHFRSYGPVADKRPAVNFGIKGGVGEFSWSGINIDLEYDPSDYPDGVSFRPIDGLNIDLCGLSAVANTEIRGPNIGIRLAKKGRVGSYFDILSTNWGNFATFGDDAGKYAIFGMSAVQNPQSIRSSGKGEKVAPVFADHGPHRTSRPDEKFAICKFISMAMNSWGEIQSVQPVVRLMGSGATPKPLEMMMSEVLGLMNTLTLAKTSRAGGLAANRPQDLRVDSSVFITAGTPTHALKIAIGGTTITNTKFVAPVGTPELNPFDADDDGGSNLRSMVLMEDDHLTPFPQDDNINQPIRIINCTFVDLSEPNEVSTGYELVRDATDPSQRFSNYAFVNSVQHAPNHTTAVIPDAPLGDTYYGEPHPYQARYYFDKVDTVVEETQYGVDNDAMALFDLKTGSAAIGDGVYAVVRDARGVMRPENGSDRGWLEVIT